MSATLKTTLGLKLQEQIDSLKNPVEKNNKIKEDQETKKKQMRISLESKKMKMTRLKKKLRNRSKLAYEKILKKEQRDL